MSGSAHVTTTRLEGTPSSIPGTTTRGTNTEPQPRNSVPAQRSLSSWGLNRRLDFSRGCAVRVPVAPTVRAVQAYLLPWWHRVRADACVVCWLDACVGPGWGVAFLGSCSVVGPRWWAGVSYPCVPSVVSCSRFRLPMHASPSHLFVTTVVRKRVPDIFQS